MKTHGRGRAGPLVGVDNQTAGSDWVFFSKARLRSWVTSPGYEELWVSFQPGCGQVRCKHG